MYPQFFGLTQLPFRLRPDPEFRFSDRSYLQSRAAVLAALRGGSRLVLLLGPPGVGKTLLLEDIMGEVNGQFASCRINQPHISPTELIHALLLQIGSASANADAGRPALFQSLAVALESLDTRQAIPLLVIDDAHLLGVATLQAITDILARSPRMKMVLVGRDEPQARGDTLTTRLAAVPSLRQVSLQPLSAEGTEYYINHRIQMAGGGGKQIFTADAYRIIFAHSGGAARLINVLCDAALHAACVRASGHVGAAEIMQATEDSRWPQALARNSEKAPVDRTAPEPPLRTAALVVTHRQEHVVTWPLAAGRISIGRAADNELRLDAPYISRHHCQVMTVDNVSSIEDLGSVNGISVNGNLTKHHVLQHADRIALGEHVVTYVVNPQP